MELRNMFKVKFYYEGLWCELVESVKGKAAAWDVAFEYEALPGCTAVCVEAA